MALPSTSITTSKVSTIDNVIPLRTQADNNSILAKTSAACSSTSPDNNLKSDDLKSASKTFNIGLQEIHVGQNAYLTPKLPQYTIMFGLLDKFTELPDLEEAFVRGSLQRGEGDKYSDVDLLCVVSPEHFQNFLTHSKSLIENESKAVFKGWLDTIVPKFGGTGHVFFIPHENNLYQLDLYVACAGHPDIRNLHGLSAKSLIYNIDKKAELNVSPGKQYELHSQKIQQHLDSLNTTTRSPEYLMVEMFTLAFIIKKCLLRNDIFVASSEFNVLKQALVKMVRLKFDPAHFDYKFYHLERLQMQSTDSSKIYQQLYHLFNGQPSNESLSKSLEIGLNFMSNQFPDSYQKLHSSAQNFLEHFERGMPPVHLPEATVPFSTKA